MLLAIDIGNTNIVVAAFEGEQLVKKWRIFTDTRKMADEYGLLLSQLLEKDGIALSAFHDVIISSVVPAVLPAFKEFVSTHFHKEALVIGENIPNIGIEFIADHPKEVGSDLLVNAVAGYQRYGGQCIIIDFGTATTFQHISLEGVYTGVVICPGIGMSLDGLHRACAKLPRIGVEQPKKVLGNNTVDAMQSGIFWGYMGLIEGIIKRIEHEQGGEEHKVIATGGLASVFAQETDKIDIVDPDLTLFGLYHVYVTSSQSQSELDKAASF